MLKPTTFQSMAEAAETQEKKRRPDDEALKPAENAEGDASLAVPNEWCSAKSPAFLKALHSYQTQSPGSRNAMLCLCCVFLYLHCELADAIDDIGF